MRPEKSSIPTLGTVPGSAPAAMDPSEMPPVNTPMRSEV